MFDANEFLLRLFSVYSVKTQTELGERLGVSQDLISNWKTGRALPTLEMILKIAEERGLSIEWLLTGAKAATSTKEAPSTGEDEALSLASGILSDAIKNATEIRQLLDDAQNRVFEGRLSADEFEGITEDLLAALESSLTKRDKSRLSRAQAHDSGA